MNNLNPEERRAKADEIARLLENEPLLAQDLGELIRGHTLVMLNPSRHNDNRVCSCGNGTFLRE